MLNRWWPPAPADLPPAYRLRLIDGTLIQEPGPTGSWWRIHYAVRWPLLQCDAVTVTPRTVGESLVHYRVQPGEVLVGDRNYARGRGVAHVRAAGGEVVLRWHPSALPVTAPGGQPWALLPALRQLAPGDVGDWPVQVTTPDGPVVGRLCAVRQSPAAGARALAEVREHARKDRYRLSERAVALSAFVVVFTTLPAPQVSARQVLACYRARWQIELVFKRLKSVLGLSHLPKREAASAQAWLHGKLLVAALLEASHRQAGLFFPWGYPLD